MRVVRERSRRKRLHALRELGSLAPHGDGLWREEGAGCIRSEARREQLGHARAVGHGLEQGRL